MVECLRTMQVKTSDTKRISRDEKPLSHGYSPANLELSYVLNQRLRELIDVLNLGKVAYRELLPEKIKHLIDLDKLEAEFEKMIKASEKVIKDLSH